MARDYDSVVSEVSSRLRLDSSATTLVEGWVNDVIQDVHGRHDWFWTLDRQIVQTVIDKTAGTVDVSAAGTAVTGASTAFAAADVGKFIQFSGSNDWYKITAVASATSLTIEAGYNGTSALSAGTYTIRKIFYALPDAEKILGAKQAQTSRELVCINHRDFDTYLTFSDSTGKGTLFAVYGTDSDGVLQFNIHPHADAAYNIEVKYKKKATQSSVTLMPEKWRGVYIDGAMVRGLEYLSIGNDELMKSSSVRDKKADYERGISRMLADAEPESDYRAVLANNDAPNTFLGNNLPTGLSIPLD